MNPRQRRDALRQILEEIKSGLQEMILSGQLPPEDFLRTVAQEMNGIMDLGEVDWKMGVSARMPG